LINFSRFRFSGLFIDFAKFEKVEKVFYAEFGQKIKDVFKEFDPVAFSAASIGQVHKAVLHSGKTVAVKVQRDEIQVQIKQDLELCQSLMNYLEDKTEWGKRYNLKGKFCDIQETLINELDYEKEARNLKILKENLKEFDRIRIPIPYDSYCRKRVLTMEYISSINIKKLSPEVLFDAKPEELSRQLFRSYLKQIFIDGFFQMDPHPGNIYLSDDAKLAIFGFPMFSTIFFFIAAIGSAFLALEILWSDKK